MWAGRCTPVGVVTKLMDVHPTLSIGIVSTDVEGNSGRRGLGALFEGYCTGDFRVTSKDGNWMLRDG